MKVYLLVSIYLGYQINRGIFSEIEKAEERKKILWETMKKNPNVTWKIEEYTLNGIEIAKEINGKGL